MDGIAIPPPAAVISLQELTPGVADAQITADTWNSGVSGNWTVGSDWSTGSAPTSSNDVTIAAAGTYIVTINSSVAANSLTINDASATVADTSGGTLAISTTLAITAGTFSLGSGSTLSGGTVSLGSSGVFAAAGGTLNGVTYQGVLDLSAGNALLYAAGGLTVKSAGGGSGTIDLTGDQAALIYTGTATLDNVTVDIGSVNGSYLDGESGTLTLGSGANLVQIGAQAYLGEFYNAEAFVNLGTITAGYSGGFFNIAGPGFTNAGQIAVSNGDTASIFSTTWTNTGTITATGTGTVLSFEGNWTNSGSVSVGSNALLNLGGSFSTSSLSGGTLGTGATVEISGNLNNTGATLIVGTGSEFGAVSLSGTVTGGTITDAGGGIVADFGTLNGVTYEGVLNLSAANAVLFAMGTLTFEGSGGSGAGIIDLTGNAAALIYTGSSKLNNVTMNIGSTGGSYLDGEGGTLTFGSGTSLIQAGAKAYLGGIYNAETFVNLGALTAGYGGGSFTISGPGFTNSGSIAVANGDKLSMASVTAFTNLGNSTLTGGTYEVDAGSTFQLLDNGTIVTDAATIILSGTSSVIKSLNTTTNNKITIDQTLVTIAGSGALELLAGRNFNASAAFTDNGLLQLGGVTFTAASGLRIGSAGSVSGYGTVHAAVADAGGIAASGGTLSVSGAVTGGGGLSAAAGATVELNTAGALTEAISGAGTLELHGGGAQTLAAGATASIATIQIDKGATLSGAGAVSGALSDAGTLTATSGTFGVAGAVTGAGALTAASGAILDLAGGGSFTGKIQGAGTLQLGGGKAFTLQNGAVLSIAAVIVDGGATLYLTQGGNLGSRISGAGTLQLHGATAYKVAGATLGIATLMVDGGATLSGYGTISGSVTDAGTITASGGMLQFAGAITGSGGLTAAAGATLDLTAGGRLGGNISGAGALQLDGATYTISAGTILPISKLRVEAGATLSGSGTVQGSVADAGTVNAAGGTLKLGSVTGAGTLSAAAGAVLNLAGGGSFSGNLGGMGTVDIGTALTLDQGAAFSAATIAETANIALDTSTAVSLAAGATLDMTAASGGTVDLHGPSTSSFTNNGSIVGNGAGTAELNVAVINKANVSVGSGTLSFLGTLTNNGTIDAAAGTLSVKDTVGGTGMLQIGATGTMSLLLGAGTGQTVDFLASTGLLDLTKPIDFNGVISGFGGSDVIDLLKTPETSYGFSNNVLTIKNGTATEASLHFSSGYTLADFSVTSDTNGGTFVKFV